MQQKNFNVFMARTIIGLTMCFPIFTYADGCEYDTQCKGDRICENGKCVAPASVAPTAKPADRGFGFLNSSNPQTPPANPPYFCCTISEKLGPYPNPGSDGKILKAGDACFGTSKGARVLQGRVCD